MNILSLIKRYISERTLSFFLIDFVIYNFYIFVIMLKIILSKILYISKLSKDFIPSSFRDILVIFMRLS